MAKKPSEHDPKLTAVEQLQEKPTEFLIIGIGASAGGIQALQEFFRQVPADSDMAYVVILHLSPDHDSQLASVLQRETKMPVAQVIERTLIRPNHIYVVPPDRHLTMEDSYIAVSPNLYVEERRAPVDIFFRTLADQHGPRAISVVLSGTGANGSMGLKRIKERGGATFVQNPREAEFNEMPRNSIATGLVDEVLNVADIPGKIIAYRTSMRTVQIVLEAEQRPEDQQQALREIFTLLRQRTGHDFSNYKRPTLLRRIERRINVRGLPGLPTYAKFLHENVEEATALLKDLLISVTNFFRDKKAFETLEQEIIPLLLKGKKSEDQVRIWAAGCATGEEAYSIAMLCLERTAGLIDAPRLQIFATDIDEAAIAHAREGLYTINDLADVSPERLRRFFNKEGDGYRVRREIREIVMFAFHNFLKDPPFSHLNLVSCRNVMIYLNQVAQERVIETFHFALNPGSFLFLGSSELVDGASDLYAVFNRDYHIFQSRQVGPRSYPLPDSTPSAYFDRPKTDSVQQQTSKSSERISFGDLHQQLLEEYAPPSIVVNEEYDIVHLTEKAGAYLQIVGGELSKNLLKLIKPELRLELRSALYQALQRQSPVATKGLTVTVNDRTETVNIHIRPALTAGDIARGFILVLFEPSTEEGKREVLLASDEPVARQLEEELSRIRVQLRSSNEQHDFQAEELKASNEELQASNEELRSAAEELETSKEELQSINEELRTVNQELKVKIEETSIAGNNLRNLVNSTNIGTIFLDRSFRVVLFTPAIKDIFNLRSADYGRPLSDITGSLDYDHLLQDAENVLQRLVEFEKEVRTKSGGSYLLRITPYRTDEDRIKGVVITFLDITERKKTQDALRVVEEKYRIQLEHDVEERTGELKESKEQYSSLVENTPDIITRWDKDLKLVFANSAFEGKTGAGNEHLLGKTNSEMGQPDGIAIPYMNSLRKTFETGLTVEHFNSFPTPKGEAHFYSRMTPEKNAAGEVETVLAIARDITDIRKAELEIRKGSEFLLTVIDSSLDVIQVFDAVRDEDGRIVDFTWKVNNRKGVEQNGEVDGESLLQQNPGMMPTGIFQRMVQVTETGVPNEQEQYYSYEQFRDQWFYMAIVKQNDGVVMTTRDITEEKTAANELLRLKDELAQRATDKYLQLFNSIDEGFCIIEVLFDDKGKPYDYRFMEANKAFEKQTGLVNVIGKTMKELVPDQEQYWFDAYGRIAKTGIPERFESEARALGHHYEVYAFPEKQSGENHVAVIFNYITERKRTEENLAFLAEVSQDLVRLANIEETMNVLGAKIGRHLAVSLCTFSTIDKKAGTITTAYAWNKAGLPNIIGERHLISDDHPEDFVRACRAGETYIINDALADSRMKGAILENLQAGAFINVPLLRDGEWRLNLSIADTAPRAWRKDEIELLHELTTRIWSRLERARAEEALRTSEERLQLATNAAKMGTFVYYPQEERGEPDEYMLSLFGLPLNGKLNLGEAISRIVHPNDRERYAADVANAIDPSGDGKLDSDIRVVHPDGSVRWINITAQTHFGGEPSHALQMHGVAIDITERKIGETALRESEAVFRSYVTASSDILYKMSPDWKTMNNMEGKGFLASATNAMPSWMEIYIPEHEQAKVQDAIAKAVQSKTMFELEHGVINIQGELSWVSSRAVPRMDEQGEIIEWMGAASNITERRKAEEAIRTSEAQLRAMVENLPGGAVFIVDRNLRYLLAEGEALAAAGLRSEDLVGKTIFEALPDDMQGDYEANYLRAFAGEPFESEHQSHGLTFLSRGMPLADSKGEVYAVLAISYNITERKKAEESLRTSEERLRLIIESAKGFAIFTTDAEGVINSWNAGAAEIFGWEEEEIIGQRSDVLFTKEDRVIGQPQIELATAASEGMAPDIRWHACKSGSLVFINGFTHPVYDGRGTLTGFVKIGRDMTAQHNAETALRKSEESYRHRLEQEVEQQTAELREINISLRYANENLQQFASIASHDLQEPLRKVRLFTFILKKNWNDVLPVEGKQVIHKITVAADRMSQLIKEVLEYSKIAYGAREFAQADLHQILQNVMSDLDLLLEETGATIDYPAPLPTIEAIPLQMHQVFYNLLTNAVKFRKLDGHLNIYILVSPLSEESLKAYPNLLPGKSYIEIVVSDNGIGFEQQFAEQIFQIFERLHSVDEFEGTGIGLALCKKIIENHSGHIHAVSDEGKGSAFHILLPLKQ